MPGGKVEPAPSPPPTVAAEASVDYFALLDEPRRPWLEPDALKQKFLALSAQAHPDRFHSAPEPERSAADRRFADLNRAWQCLREPRERLRHLLALELGARPTNSQSVPAELGGSFFEVGQLCREASAFLDERNRVASPLLRAQFYERGAEWSERLLEMQRQINQSRDRVLAEIRAIDAVWTAAAANPEQKAPLLKRLEELSHLLGYFGKWSEQLQTRIVQLAF
jgi:DnaJ-domain-containing protein 1